MANVDFPRGAIVIRSKNGGPGGVEYFDLASTNTAIGVGDILERRADGFVWQAVASSRQIVGIAQEAKAANVGGTIAVHPANNVVFQMQVDDATVNAQTDIGLNYDFIAGAPVNGRSVYEIDGSTQATTATLPILIERVSDVQSEEGNALGANVLVDCVFNECAYRGGGTGI